MKKIFKATFWTNIFFLIPFYISIKYNLYWYTIIIGIVFIISSIFHLSNKNKYLDYLDILSASFLILINFVLLYLGNWTLPYSAIALSLGLVSLFIYFKQKYNYDFYHSIWHIFSAIICYFSLITYISYLFK